jgi:retron-type reverse transcriptase
VKRVGGLYHEVTDFVNLESAFRKAARGRRYMNETLRFKAHKEDNLIALAEHLNAGTYVMGVYRRFTIREPKLRVIAALPFRDRVVQHAIINVIGPIMDKRLIAHTYACRKGKGAHAASETLTKWIRNHPDGYVLKCDVKNFYGSIDHDILKRILRGIFKDEPLLNLLFQIIDSTDGGVGIPIGNLTSQHFANIYLDAFDKFVKERLRERYYARYMDDFVIVGNDIGRLKCDREEIRKWLIENRSLTLKEASTVLSIKNGIDFVGYRHFITHKKTRRRSVKKMRAKIRAFKAGKIPHEQFIRILASWKGHASHADTYRLTERIVREIDGDDQPGLD